MLKAGEEASDGVLLPAGGLDDPGDVRAFGPAQEGQDCLLLGALA